MEPTTAATPAPAANDPWMPNDDGFTQLDTRKGPEHFAAELGRIAEEEPEFAPTPEEIAAADGAPAPLAAEVISTYEPQVLTLADGSRITIARTAAGFEATLQTGTSGTEVFKGKTEAALMQTVLAAKLDATKKVRQLTKQLKLDRVPAPAQRPAEPAPTKKTLSADELFDYKAQLSANPDLANEKWFQLKTGLSIEELVGLARLGAKAAEELRVESEARNFRRVRPDYHSSDENLSALLAYLDKHNLNFTAENLAQAYDELSEAGLLEQAAPAPPVLAAPPAPAPQAAPVVEQTETANERIVRLVRRPRASLGLKTSATIAVPTPSTTREPSAEELEALPDGDIEQLFAGVRRARAQSTQR